MKKFIVLLGITICLLVLSTNFVLAESSDVLIYDNLIYYKISDTNEVIITGVTSNTVPELDIPSKIGEKKVTAIGDYAFKYLSKLTTVKIPETVTEIGKNTFYECINLKNVTLPSGLEKIPDGMFYQCSALETIAIPKTVTEIGEYAFKECTSLGNIELHEGINTIKCYAFYGCKALTNLTLPPTLTVIEESTFEYCEKITTIVIPDKVTCIGYGAFAGCIGLTKVTIPECVKRIEAYAFMQCISLKSVNIPEGVTAIESCCFSGCKNLSGVTLPETVKKIEHSAFSTCTKLTEITIPCSVKEIENSAFSFCKNLKKVTLSEGLEVIGQSAFQGCETIENIKLPSTVKQIGELAFGNCVKLTNIKLNEGLEKIGSLAFSNCQQISSIDIPSTVREIGADAFSLCIGVKNITIGEENKDFCLDKGVLYDAGITRIIICSKGEESTDYIMPETVVTADQTVFTLCTKLKTVTLSKNLTSISGMLFALCTELEKIEIPESVGSIGESAFRSCEKLTQVNLPETIEKIGAYAFYACPALQTVNYSGTYEQFKEITIEYGNTFLIKCHRDYISANSIVLDKINVKIKVNDVVSLKETVYPINATDKSVFWETSNSGVVDVEDGMIKGNKVGEATITVLNSNGKNIATCLVTVSEKNKEPLKPMITSISAVYDMPYTYTDESGKEKTVPSGVAFAKVYDQYGNYELKEYGMLLADKNLEKEEFTLLTEGVIKGKGEVKQNINGQFGIMFYGNGLQYGETYYTISYAIYEDESGNEITIYGDKITEFSPKGE